MLIMPCAVTAYPLGRPQLWFERALDRESNGYDWCFGKNFRGKQAERKVWQKFTRPNGLFLSTAIQLTSEQLNREQLKPAFDWIAQGLIVAVHRTALNPMLTLELMQSDSGGRSVDDFMRAADVGIERMELREAERRPPGQRTPVLGEPHIEIGVEVPERRLPTGGSSWMTTPSLVARPADRARLGRHRARRTTRPDGRLARVTTDVSTDGVWRE